MLERAETLPTKSIFNYIVLRYNGKGTLPVNLPNKDGIPYGVLEEFRHEIRRFLNFSERAARKAGVEPQQHQALLAIKAVPAGGKATIGFLARRLLIRHNSAVELSNRLEGKKLIRRSRSGTDRREVLLTLTAGGGKLLHRLSALHHAELQTAGPRLLKALHVASRAGAK
jgi:DNA-binding MarR family transcriptional regulator